MPNTAIEPTTDFDVLRQLLVQLAESVDAIVALARDSRFEDVLDALVARDLIFDRVRDAMAAAESLRVGSPDAEALATLLHRAQRTQAFLADVMAAAHGAIRQDLELVERKLATGDGYTLAAATRGGTALDVRR